MSYGHKFDAIPSKDAPASRPDTYTSEHCDSEEDGWKLTCFLDDPWFETCRTIHRYVQIVSRWIVLTRQINDCLTFQLSNRDLGSFCQAMIGRHEADNRFNVHCFEGQPGYASFRSDKSEIDIAAPERFKLVAASHFSEMEFQAGLGAPCSFHKPGKHLKRCGPNGADSDDSEASFVGSSRAFAKQFRL
ncbi:hypothetical protein UP06_14285 [Bradyrhizobium sp. LTSP857]|nr:hypothetical protein UP06_14285 [Bradyrhizobium sp. LTSP857]